jgi:hypothetical protein
MARADFEMRHARIPSAYDLGLNRTVGEELLYGKGLVHDSYGEHDLSPALENLFDDGLDEQLVGACPMNGGWSGLGLEL